MICLSCERERAANVIATFKIGTNVYIGGESGDVVAHEAQHVIVQLHDTSRQVRARPEMLIRSRHQPNIDEELPEDDCVSFGLGDHEVRLLSEWILERIGFVIGSGGLVGSGVFVITSSNRIALLTARHVLDDAQATGSIAIVACGTECESADGVSRRPGEVTGVEYALRSTIADAALLVLPPGFEPASSLRFEDWEPEGYLAPKLDDAVASAGVPGDYQTGLDVARRKIERLKVSVLFSRVTRIDDQTGDLQFYVSPYRSGVTSFQGMSGGPIFSLPDRRLIGINRSQQITFIAGIVNATPRGVWRDLVLDD